MKRFALAILALLISAPPLWAAAPLTLDEALAMALKQHPQVVGAKENLHGAEARTGQALAGYYPQISIAADWSKGRTFLTPLESIKTTEANIEGVYLKQTIFDFGRTAAAVAAARAGSDAAGRAVAVTRQDLALRVKSAFYLVLAAEKQVTAVKETVTARQEIFRQAREFFNQGIRAKVDVARAEANLFAARTSLIRAENNLELARVELATAMGIPTLGDRAVLEPPAAPLSLPGRDDALADALHNRAELQQAADLKRAAEAGLKAARGSYLPVISGTASIGYGARDFPPDGNVWAVGLNLTMPLFSGFSSVEQVREATAGINAVAARQDELRLEIGKEVESARLGEKEAAARIVSTEKEMAAADENRALAEGRYREGVGSIIEVTDAQSQALDARTANIQARFDHDIAVARLARAIGME